MDGRPRTGAGGRAYGRLCHLGEFGAVFSVVQGDISREPSEAIIPPKRR